MLSALFLLGAFVASGVQAQDAMCVAESNGVEYEFCGRILDINVYWTFQESTTVGSEIADGMLSLIIEAADDSWYGVGFSDQQVANSQVAMLAARVAFGCHDFPMFPADSVYDVQLPASNDDRNVMGVGAALTANNTQSLMMLTQTREDGICAIRFQREAQPTALDLEPQKQIVDDQVNGMIFASGDPATPARHTSQTFALIDLPGGTSTPALGAVQLINPAPAPDGDSASVVGLSQLLPAVVASTLYALW